MSDNNRKQPFAISVQASAEEAWNSFEREESSRKSENDLCQNSITSVTPTRDLGEQVEAPQAREIGHSPKIGLTYAAFLKIEFGLELTD